MEVTFIHVFTISKPKGLLLLLLKITHELPKENGVKRFSEPLGSAIFLLRQVAARELLFRSPDGRNNDKLKYILIKEQQKTACFMIPATV